MIEGYFSNHQTKYVPSSDGFDMMSTHKIKEESALTMILLTPDTRRPEEEKHNNQPEMRQF